MKHLISVVLSLALAGCTTAPPLTTPKTVHIVAGTAVGDPCGSERMLIDTPRGYPRLCVKGKWVPFCDLAQHGTELQELCESYGIGSSGAK